MAEITLGNKYNFLRHVITLESIGTVTVTVGRGVCLGIGTATRGPAMTPFGIAGSTPSLIKKTYYSGKLKEDLETAAAQGPSVLYGLRVMGEGYATASMDVTDSQDDPAGTFTAVGPGTWGNIPTITIANGDLDGTRKENFAGDGTVGPYTLEMNDLVESSTNYVRVGGSSRTIIYTGTPDPGEVLMDPDTGELTFATGQAPTTAQLIEVRYKYHSRKITLQDEGGVLPVVYNNVMSQAALVARMKADNICTYAAEVGVTHLPATMAATNMTGGLEGSAITIDDWEAGFNAFLELLPNSVYPSSIFSTDYEATTGQSDIVPLMDQFLWEMANRPIGKMKPLQGFVSLNPEWTAEECSDFKEGYTNLFMTLITNGFDQNEKNLAAARAGQEAALGLGVSPATDSNSFKGITGLLFQWTDAEREVLNSAGLEVLIKETGVHPYVGVSTDLDDNFFRAVDVRTICEVIVIIDVIVKKFLNERRTLTNLTRIKTSIDLLLKRLKESAVLDDASIDVKPDASDRNAVNLDVMIQPVGHMERFYTTLGVGYYSSNIAA